MSQGRHTVYLIRHGLTSQNLRREYQGSVLNYGILPESRLLIEERQKRGAVPPARTLWVSPLLRARQTAELYFPHLEGELVPDLVEREFGDWDGRTHKDLMSSDQLYMEFLQSFGRVTPPGGESFEDFFKRMQRVMDAMGKLAQSAPDRFPLALVFHGGPILHLTDFLLSPEDPLHRYHCKGAGGLQLEIRFDPFRVEEARELFTDDIPVEKTPFYLDYQGEGRGGQ